MKIGLFRFFILLLTFSLVASVHAFPAHAAVSCGSSAAAQNGIRVTPSQGQAFYIDTGASPKLDAGYVGYQVNNSTGSAQSNLWVELSSFSGNVISLANADDAQMQLASTTNNATTTAYFLLKASGATTQAQAHTVRVYNGRPDVSGSSLLYECTYSFSKVQETIKAASNKVTDNTNDSVAITASTQSPELGQTFTITVEGQTGTIGNGSSPDGSIVWLTPAAVSSWPTRALRLVNVSITFDTNSNWSSSGDQVTYTNQLAITNAKTALSNSAEYRATYTFRVVGKPTATVSVVPLASISSGTQIKHADTTATGATINLSFTSLSINATLAKTVTATTSLTTVTCGASCTVPGGTNGMTYAAVPYRLRVTTATSTVATVDEMVDLPPSGVIFKPSSATVTDIGRTGVAISDPVLLSSESTLSPRPYHFIGPYTFNSGTPASISYTMYVPIGTFINTAYAVLGDTFIGANASAMSQVTVTSDGSATVTAATSTQSFPVNTITQPATSIGSTGATLNGVVDPNGTTSLTGTFEYGTSPSLTTYTTVTATTPSGGILNGLSDPTLTAVTLSGLSVGTTYYFRAVAGDTKGDILSFTTNAVVAAPTVTTQAASGISLTQATLNGTINPNLTAITAIQFIYGTNSTLSTGVSTTTLDDGTGVTLTAGGSSAQPFATTTGTLTGGSTYYYKIRACTASTGTYPNITCSSYVDGSVLNFVAYGAPNASTTAATSVGASLATLNGVIKANYATTTAVFQYGTSSTLTSYTTVSAGSVTGFASTTVTANITGLTSATTYYFRVVGSNASGTTTATILSFTTSAVNRTLTIDAGSYTSSYAFDAAPPTITSTPSAGTGTKSYTSNTTNICTIDPSSGLVTFVSSGTCTLGASIAANGGFTDASSPTISFTITSVNRTLTIDAGSYTSSYAFDAAPPTITSTPSAGTGTLSYTSETGSVCTVDSISGLISFVSTGTCTVHADITAADPYNAATSIAISFAITNASRTISIDGSSYISSYAVTANPPTLTATPSAGTGTISFTSNTTDVCTVNSGTGLLAFLSVGTCSIRAVITAGGGYGTATSSAISITLSLASRSLGIDGSSYTSSYAYNATPPTLTSTASAGSGTKSYSSLTSSTCAVNSSTGEVTFLGVGTCTLQGSISSDGTYADATSGSISFSITSLSRTLAIDGSSYTNTYIITDNAPTLTSTASTGSGTKSYTSLTGSVCAIGSSSGAVTFLSIGTCTLRASITANGVYTSATSSSISFTIDDVPPAPGLTSRTLAIDGGSYTATYSYGSPAPTLSAAPSVGTGTTTFTGLTSDVCTVNSETGVVTFVSVGTCRIRASITEDLTYAAATSPTISFDILSLSRTLTIDSSSYVSSYTISAIAPTITATASAGGGIKTFGSINTGICTVNSSTGAVTFVSAGTCIISSSIASSGLYASADAINISFTLTNDSVSRTLTINNDSYVSSYVSNDEVPTLTATPSAGAGAITFTSLTSGVCSINSSTGAVSFVSTGTCRLQAAIDSDGTYGVATSTAISFEITSPSERSERSGRGGRSSIVRGCTDVAASNYDSRARHDDGSCKYNKVTTLVTNGEVSPQRVNEGSGVTPPVCSAYLTTYIRLGAENSVDEVKKLQTFLNSHEGESLAVDGVYKEVDALAVKRFQQKHPDTLTFWNTDTPTGYVYITTQRAVNRLYCEAASQITCPYFTAHVQQGDVSPEVVKIKAFLNQVLGLSLDTSSDLYDMALTEAVKRFQRNQINNVLTPWGLSQPTGRWYQSTRKAANDSLGCFQPVKLDNGKVLK